MSENNNNKKNNRKDFFNNFFESFGDFFQSGDFSQFPDMDWINNPEVQEKLKELGKVFWGFSSSTGPDGVPQTKASLENNVENNYNREPFIDIIEEEDHIKILAELPGAKKDDIDLKARHDGLKLSTGNFEKFIPLDIEIDPKSIKAHYNNGVLEIRINIKNKEIKDPEFQVKVN